jgi:hypothetical protein
VDAARLADVSDTPTGDGVTIAILHGSWRAQVRKPAKGVATVRLVEFLHVARMGRARVVSNLPRRTLWFPNQGTE